MSYLILYTPSFIRLDEETVVPFVVQGDSEQYNTPEGRGMPSRSRDVELYKGMVSATQEFLEKEIQDTWDKVVKQVMANKYDVDSKLITKEGEVDEKALSKKFGYHVPIAIEPHHTRQTTFRTFKNFFLKKGMKTAMTVEQFLEVSGMDKLKLTMAVADGKTQPKYVKRTATTTDGLKHLISEYEKTKDAVSLSLKMESKTPDVIIKQMQKQVHGLTKRTRQNTELDTSDLDSYWTVKIVHEGEEYYIKRIRKYDFTSTEEPFLKFVSKDEAEKKLKYYTQYKERGYDFKLEEVPVGKQQPVAV